MMKNNNLLKLSIVPVILLLASIMSLPTRAYELISHPTAEGNLDNWVFMPLVARLSSSGNGTYFMSPNGDDGKSGRSESQAWATFTHAWQFLYPGDTLILLDGIYYQSLAPNIRNGEPGMPITIKAKNDGKAIIDGQHQRVTVSLKLWHNDWWVGDWFVIEGIVARNSSESVYKIAGNHNILRRVSGYNANTDINEHVFTLSSGEYNLLEDCIASGTGRKMAFFWGSNNGIIRRCFTNWVQFDAREFCGEWPWGEDLEIYNSSDSIIENSISYGSPPATGVSVLGNINSSNGGQPHSRNNQVLGVISIRNGVFSDGTIKWWGTNRPQPTQCNNLSMLDKWTNFREGFGVITWGEKAEVTNTLFQDIFAWGNAGLGFTELHQSNLSTDTTINRATIANNGLDAPSADGGIGSEVNLADISHYTITNSYIEGTQYQGEGALMQHIYKDGELMDGSNGKVVQPLWPWLMQNRILTELGIDVTGELTEILMNAGVPTGANLPAPTISPSPPPGDIVNGPAVVSYFEPVQVTLSTQTAGAVIRYTTDGSEPISISPQYTSPITISSTTILKAKAFHNGKESHARSAYFKINTSLKNEPPIVEAALLPFVYPIVEIMLPTNQIDLYGTAKDHTLPNGTSQLDATWSVNSGPGGVTFDDSKSLRTKATFSQAGTYVLRLTVSDGQMSAHADATVIVYPDGGLTYDIPGRIDTENYKGGGEGIAFHDTSAGNNYQLYRFDGVDIMMAYNDYYGYAITHMVPGEWVAYDINVTQSGTYQVNVRLSGADPGGVFHLELDGVDITGPITIPFTNGGLRIYTTVSTQTTDLAAGLHELRIVADQVASGKDDLRVAINYIEFQ